MPNMDYSLIQRTPDGTGKILVTTPGSPDKGSYVLEADMKIYTNQGMVAIADIVDDLVTADATKPLSANQGVVLKQLIDAFSGGIVPKGDILSSNLPAASASNKGWQYYCTDINQWATSDGTQWIMTSNNVITQTPDATDTGHALSNAVVTQCCNEVKGKLNQHESRLENLEQKAGDYTTVQYRGTDAVPTGKAKNGLVEKIVGKSRAWNQLCDNTPSSKTMNEITFTNNNDGSWTINGTATDDATITFSDAAPVVPANHKVLIALGIRTAIQGIKFGRGGFGYTDSVDFIHSYGTAFSARPQLKVEQGATVNNLKVYPKSFDLTLIFGPGNEPSTVADALAQLPALGQYNAYNAGSLVDTEVSGARSVGVNIWDEQPQIGSLYSDGSENNTVTNQLRSDYIPVLRSTSYYIKSTNGYAVYVRFYDVNKKAIGSTWNYQNIKNTSFTTSANTVYIRFILLSDYGTTYNNDIQICLNSYADKTTYHPHKTDTLSLSETVTLRGVGTCVETLDVETGVLDDGKFELVDMDDLEWTQVSVYYRASISGAKLPATPNDIANILSSNYKTVARNYTDHDGDIALETGGTVIVRTPTVPTGMLLYEKATYTPSSPIDPITDNFIEVEGGGTIDTIQTQTPVIDNSLDVGYLTL